MDSSNRTTSTTRSSKNHIQPRDDLPVTQDTGTRSDSDIADHMLSLAQRINEATAEAEGHARARDATKR